MTPIYSRISKAAQVGMEKWFEDGIVKELDKAPKTLDELLQRFKCGRKTLITSLARMEKKGKVERVNHRYILKK